MIKEGVMIGGRYEIMGRIGTGGMADVYKAVDRVLNRYVAMKVLKREFREDVNFVKKFQSEAQAAAGLLHPNIVNVYDVAEDRGLYYIVMELVEGITLKDYIQKKGKLTAKEVLGITMQVCAGIETAHNNNIVHRDIKPQNIIISKEGKVKVTDFGIAKATSSNTISTNAMGSVHYTSPEQARGGFSDARSDIYSLGITMYEMITGKLPFDGDSTISIALKHLQEDILPPSEYVLDIPYSLEQIILKCTQKSPDRRYTHVSQLLRDLKRSVQEPEGDFVRISPLTSVNDTILINTDDIDEMLESKYNSKEEEYDDYESERKTDKRGGKEEKEDIDPKMTKIMKILTITVSVIFILLVLYLAGSAAGIIKFGPGVLLTTQKNVVPELVGLTQEEAEKACKRAGLRLEVDEEKESLNFEKGQIIHQKSQVGAELVEGGIVHVTVCSMRLIEVPDLSKKDYIDARDKLLELGFSKTNIVKKEQAHDDIAEDKVIKTDPKAEKIVRKDSQITVYVSAGLPIVKVPDLIGMTEDEARLALEELGLKASPSSLPSTEEVGKVYEQKTAPNEEVEKGTVIKFTVSLGKDKVLIPANLRGNPSDVRTELKLLGLEVKFEYSESYAGVPYGEVAAVEGEGTEVFKGSTVVVYVSEWEGNPPEEPDDNLPEGTDGETNE